MPQLTLEFSSNILEKDNITNLLKDCNSALVKSLPNTGTCKARAIEVQLYCIGNGHSDNRLLAEPASGRQVLEDLGAQDRNVLNVHEDPSTKSTTQLPAEVGLCEKSNAFVHVSLKIKAGRSVDILKNTGDLLMQLLKDYFAESLKMLNLEITLEIMELEKTYFKYVQDFDKKTTII